MKTQSDPYSECADCKDLGHCPHPDVKDDMFGTALPPDVCLRPNEIMKATEKKYKLTSTKNGLS